MMSPGLFDKELKKAVEELYYWQHSNGKTTNFHSMLYTLFKKADEENYRKLSLGFRAEATALKMWECAGDYGNDLFRAYGLIKYEKQSSKKQ